MMEKKISSYGVPTKNVLLWTFVCYSLPRGDQAWVSLDFGYMWVGGEDLYQIWCLIQNSHYGCACSPHLETYFIKLEAFHWIMGGRYCNMIEVNKILFNKYTCFSL